MVNFAARWDEITDLIRSQAPVLGVAPENVVQMAFEQGIHLVPPYIAVAMIPGDYTASISGSALTTRATVEIFCVSSDGDSNAARIVAAQQMAANILGLLLEHEVGGMHVPPQPILLDTVEALFVAVNLQISVEYDLGYDTTEST